MKGKIKMGRGQAGLHRYIFSESKGTELIGGSTTPDLFLPHVAALRRLRPDVRQSAIHISISHDPTDPRKMTSDDWRAAVEIVRREMEMDDLEYLAGRHGDTDHDHLHIEACKIKPDGSLWDDSHSARRLHRACEQIERELGLKMTLTVEQHRKLRKEGKARKPMSDGALRQFQRTGTVPNKTKEAIARRIKNERENANRAAHISTSQDHGILDESSAGNPEKNHQPGQKHPSPASRAGDGFEPNREARDAGESAQAQQAVRVTPAAARPAAPQHVKKEIQMQNQMQKQRRPQQDDGLTGFSMPGFSMPGSGTPPTLGGKLLAVPSGNGKIKTFDLFWPDARLPSFRWSPSENRILSLASPPNETAVRALFDLAREKGLGMPQIQITGTPEFQLLAAREAARRGIPVDKQRLDPSARAAYESTYSQQHGDSVNGITAAAYESADRECERIAAAAERRAKNDAKNDDDQNDEHRTGHGQKMRG